MSVLTQVPWRRAGVLAAAAVLGTVLLGLLAWAVLWADTRGALPIADAGAGIVPVVGTLLGGRFVGAYAGFGHDGVWALGLSAPVLLGWLLARAVPRDRPLPLLVGGAALTAVLHAATVLALGTVEVLDPTSFAVARVSWIPGLSVLFAVIVWSTVWLVVHARLGRAVVVGLLTCVVLGSLLAAVSAEGVSTVGALLGGALLGPNLLGLATVAALGADTATLGGASETARTFAEQVADLGDGWWLAPIAVVGPLVLAGWRAEAPDSGAAFGRRSRDVVVATVSVVAGLAAFASPRTVSAARETWLGVPEVAQLVLPVVVLSAAVLAPQIVRAVREGDEWPAAPLRFLRGLATARPAPRPAPHAPSPLPPTGGGWQAAPPPTGPAAPPPTGPVGPHPPVGAPYPAAGAGTAPAAPAPTAAPGPPPTDPFDDDAPPPVSAKWRDVPAAADDPGARPTGPAAPPPAARPAPSWPPPEVTP